MKKLVLILVLCAAPLMAQNIRASSTANDAITKGVTVSFTYQVPADNAYLVSAKNDPAIAPAKTTWLWGDEGEHAKSRNYTEAKYGEVVSHTFAKPGTYGVMVIVTDVKNRGIVQEAVTIKINQPFEVVTP